MSEETGKGPAKVEKKYGSLGHDGAEKAVIPYFVVVLGGQELISPTSGLWDDCMDYADKINTALADLPPVKP